MRAKAVVHLLRSCRHCAVVLQPQHSISPRRQLTLRRGAPYRQSPRVAHNGRSTSEAPGQEKDQMRYGYFMMPMHPPGSFLADTLDHDLWQIERLDQLGFHEAWIGEHYTAEWENIPSPELFIAAALQRTKQIQLDR